MIARRHAEGLAHERGRTPPARCTQLVDILVGPGGGTLRRARRLRTLFEPLALLRSETGLRETSPVSTQLVDLSDACLRIRHISRPISGRCGRLPQLRADRLQLKRSGPRHLRVRLGRERLRRRHLGRRPRHRAHRSRERVTNALVADARAELTAHGAHEQQGLLGRRAAEERREQLSLAPIGAFARGGAHLEKARVHLLHAQPRSRSRSCRSSRNGLVWAGVGRRPRSRVASDHARSQRAKVAAPAQLRLQLINGPIARLRQRLHHETLPHAQLEWPR